jgi:hypothetical protein
LGARNTPPLGDDYWFLDYHVVARSGVPRLVARVPRSRRWERKRRLPYETAFVASGVSHKIAAEIK